MNYQIASKYSGLFKLFSDPFAILVTSYLLGNEAAQTMEVIAKETEASNSKIYRTCEKLYGLGIVDRGTQGEEPTYEVLNSNENTKVARNILSSLN